MSIVIPKFDRVTLWCAALPPQVVGAPTAKIKLLADSSATGECAFSTVGMSRSKKAPMERGRIVIDRYNPEMFYMIGGVLHVLSGPRSSKPGRAMSSWCRLWVWRTRFQRSVAPGRKFLIVIAPGVERFEYFRQLTRIAQGQQPPESLRDVQDLYDTYFFEQPRVGTGEAARVLTTGPR